MPGSLKTLVDRPNVCVHGGSPSRRKNIGTNLEEPCLPKSAPRCIDTQGAPRLNNEQNRGKKKIPYTYKVGTNNRYLGIGRNLGMFTRQSF